MLEFVRWYNTEHHGEKPTEVWLNPKRGDAAIERNESIAAQEERGE